MKFPTGGQDWAGWGVTTRTPSGTTSTSPGSQLAGPLPSPHPDIRRMPLVPTMIQELVFALPPLGEASVLDLLCKSICDSEIKQKLTRAKPAVAPAVWPSREPTPGVDCPPSTSPSSDSISADDSYRVSTPISKWSLNTTSRSASVTIHHNYKEC